ncbi:P-loop NTPase fold protein [Streptomyces chartreusis]
MQNTTSPVPVALVPLACDTDEERNAYGRAVEATMASPRTRRHLNARSAVTDEAVRTQLMSDQAISEALRHVQASLTVYREAVTELAECQAELDRRRQAAHADVRSVATLVFVAVYMCSAAYMEWFRDPSLWEKLGVAAALGVVGTPIVIATLVNDTSLTNLKNQLAVFWNALRLPRLYIRRYRTSRHWDSELQTNGVPRVATQVIDALMGEDPHSALLPGSYEGLRSPNGEGWVVNSAAMEQLQHKLSILEGGTVAVCGPRGAGKTTLLDSAARQGDLTVTIRVPAAYTPYDLVLTTFVKVCERYMQREGYPLPQLTRLSGFVRTRQRLHRALSSLGWRLLFGIPAAALLILGTAHAARGQWDEYSNEGWSWARGVRRWSAQHAEEIWQGHSIGAAIVVILAGLWLWSLRTSTPWRRRLLSAPVYLARAGATFLILIPLASLIKDREIRDHAWALLNSESWWLVLELILFLAFLGCFIQAGEAPRTVTRRLWMTAAYASLTSAAVFPFRSADVRAIVLDDGNLVRLTYGIAGALLLKVSSLRTRRAEPALVTRCRDHLYQLRTAQSTSAALNLGIAQAATFGTAHTSAISSVPPNFPQLVDDLRTLLAGIATRIHAEQQRTVICLDELDRLGSDQQALAFLSEIKAILGVPRVHYLISVAEDVGAAFVRRGLPHRDATDSSLDDVVHVQPSSLVESIAIMEKRADDLTEPYVLLAHALSGGIPRDLIRYGRRMLEMLEGRTAESRGLELVEVSHRLIKEELRDTIAGFRTLLAKQQWTADNADWLSRYRILNEHLQHTCPHRTSELVAALQYVAADITPAPGPTEPPETARQLIIEASAYTYFALTLLQIFQPLGFDGRRKDAARTRKPAAHPHVLAEVRLELAVSPHSARPMINAVREAWLLAPFPTPDPSDTIPPPRTDPCPLCTGALSPATHR